MMSEERQYQVNAFLQQCNLAEAVQQKLSGDASFRHYTRIIDGNNSFMLMDAPPASENVRPFVAVANALHLQFYSVPQVIEQDVERGFLLLEDLGDDTFSRIFKDAVNVADTEQLLYQAALDLLLEWRKKSIPIDLPIYDNTLLLKEVTLFADWYLPAVLGKKAAALREGYLHIWQQLLVANPLMKDCFVHRDYHADNLIWLPERDGIGQVGLLDFQDAVLGHPAYDLVSLIEDARRDVPPLLAQTLRQYYQRKSGDGEAFETAYALLGAQRNSKIIGIFMRLAKRDGKIQYVDFLPRVWKYLWQDLQHPALAPLKGWMEHYLPQEYYHGS